MAKTISQVIFSNTSGKTLPNPTPADLEDPIFNAIWNVVKHWGISDSNYYSGYMGGNGSHVKLIFDEVKIAIRDKKLSEILPNK
jgi:hypothetical protein